MRIAFVIYGSLDAVSGGFIYDRALVAALRGLGHEVDVVGLPWQGYARSVGSQLLPRGRGRGRGADRNDAGAARLPASHDVVIQDELIHPSVFRQNRGRGLESILPHAPVTVALVHNLRSAQPGERFRGLKERVERRYFATVGGVIAVCARTLADVEALVGRGLAATIAYPGRDHVAPGVDEGWIAHRSAAPGPLRVLYAGAVSPHKGLHRLLDGLARAVAGDPAFDFELDVVGGAPDPAYVRRIRRQLARLGLSNRVQLHGQLQGSRLQDLFRASHVLALPSDREAYSLSSLEALGFGLPVVGTAAGGLGEMFVEGESGHLLDPDDVDAWGQTLRALGANRARLTRMGIAALARHHAHGEWRDVALTVQHFLHEQLRARPPGDVGLVAGRATA